MNWLIVLIGVTFISFVASETYTDRYDNINVDEILKNKRLLSGYIKCMLDQGRCTPEGKELKQHVQDGMQTACAKCTDTQKVLAKRVVSHIREKEPDTWEKLKAKYDPGDQFKETYEAFLASQD